MGPGTDCVGERRVEEEVKAALARWVFLGLIRGLQLQLLGSTPCAEKPRKAQKSELRRREHACMGSANATV